ncbi:uncharacterized protein LOC126672487 [Mercurialis annua]|uniref:uncharacterized protein LOC126672487 n=1 Tax=Mercurialis annua TaxID=3986 RepID=UPI00215FE5EF|nr:uncharacterized protein LOC126672487 [Mercurialis annua]
MEADCIHFGIDIIGKIHPTASNGHEFIVDAIDYFTRWVEAESYKILGAKQMAEFIETHLICRYGIPHYIVSENGVQFQAEVKQLLRENGIEHHKSSPYRPQANGAVEAANKNVKKILAKMVETYRDWSKKLPYALHGYRRTASTSTGATPYSLVYGMEVVLPVEGRLRTNKSPTLSTKWSNYVDFDPAKAAGTSAIYGLFTTAWLAHQLLTNFSLSRS